MTPPIRPTPCISSFSWPEHTAQKSESALWLLWDKAYPGEDNGGGDSEDRSPMAQVLEALQGECPLMRTLETV